VSILGQILGVLEFSAFFSSFYSQLHFSGRKEGTEREWEQGGSGAYAIFSEYLLLIWLNGEKISPFTGAFKVYF